MTRYEAAVISAYTGYFVAGRFEDLHAYIEILMGRAVLTHEIPGLKEEIQKRAKEDLLQLVVTDDPVYSPWEAQILH